MSKQVKKIEMERGQVQKLTDTMRTHLKQTASAATEVVNKIRECADRAEKNHLRLVKVNR